MTADTFLEGDSRGDTQAAVDAGYAMAEPAPLDATASRFHVIRAPAGGTATVVDLEDYLDKHRDHPKRKAGTTTLETATSLVAYLEKHELPQTEVYADPKAYRFTAVINGHAARDGHGEGPAGWGDHRAVLQLRTTEEWKAWAGKDRQWLGQAELAEHLEDNLPNIYDPPGGEVLELIENFQVKRAVEYSAAVRSSTGEVRFTYHEEDTQTAGRKGEMMLPPKITIGLAPFEGGELVRMDARLRYRLNEGRLTLSYALDRPQEVLRLAFDAAAEDVDANVAAPLYVGTPALNQADELH